MTPHVNTSLSEWFAAVPSARTVRRAAAFPLIVNGDALHWSSVEHGKKTFAASFCVLIPLNPKNPNSASFACGILAIGTLTGPPVGFVPLCIFAYWSYTSGNSTPLWLTVAVTGAHPLSTPSPSSATRS